MCGTIASTLTPETRQRSLRLRVRACVQVSLTVLTVNYIGDGLRAR